MPYSFIKLYNTGELLYLLCDRGAHPKQMFASKKRSHLFASQQTTWAAETRVLCKLPTDLYVTSTTNGIALAFRELCKKIFL